MLRRDYDEDKQPHGFDAQCALRGSLRGCQGSPAVWAARDMASRPASQPWLKSAQAILGQSPGRQADDSGRCSQTHNQGQNRLRSNASNSRRRAGFGPEPTRRGQWQRTCWQERESGGDGEIADRSARARAGLRLVTNYSSAQGIGAIKAPIILKDAARSFRSCPASEAAPLWRGRRAWPRRVAASSGR